MAVGVSVQRQRRSARNPHRRGPPQASGGLNGCRSVAIPLAVRISARNKPQKRCRRSAAAYMPAGQPQSAPPVHSLHRRRRRRDKHGPAQRLGASVPPSRQCMPCRCRLLPAAARSSGVQGLTASILAAMHSVSSSAHCRRRPKQPGSM
jgi:hypothetical protein